MRAMPRFGPRRGIAVLLLFGLPCFAVALDQDRSVNQFFHTSWTVSEGGPSGLTSMAQTTDGYLWLGTQTGLIRFDGVRFTHFDPAAGEFPSNDIASLMATPDGGLWIGFAPIGAAFLKNGHVVTYGQLDGLPSSPVYAFGQDQEGGVWAGTVRGLRRFEDSRWQTVGPDWGFPDERVDSFYLDHQGSLWVSTLDGLFSLAPRARAFQMRKSVRTLQLGETIRSARLAETRDGVLWVTEYRDVVRSFAPPQGQVDRPSDPAIEPEVRRILIDRDNSMWIFTYTDGIARIANPERLAEVHVESPKEKIEHFSEKDGLSDNRIMAALEDREGNIWVATRSGLDRFRPRNVVPGPFPYGSGEQDLALAADSEGSIWAGNLDQPLMQFRNGVVFLGAKTQRITCAFRDVDGTIWFGGEGSLERLAHGQFQTVPLPEEIHPGSNWAIHSITRDHAGDLWVSIIQNGVFRLHDGIWSHWGNIEGLPRRTALVLWTDPKGRVWLGYSTIGVAVIDGNTVQTFSGAQGLSVGSVTAFAKSGDHILVGGLSGLAVYDGQGFRTIAAAVGTNEFRGVSGIIDMPNGDLWLNQASGLTHIVAKEVAAMLIDKLHQPALEIFDSQDGVPGLASPLRPLPSAIIGGDGRIWLSGTNGTSWIDPARIQRNPLPPPVVIETILADGQKYDSSSEPRLPVLPSNIRIEYTALSLTIPDRVRFRYRLEGFDKEWQAAGSRRAAFYTNLPPGRYNFRVVASNNDGVWNEAGAAVTLTVPPAFFQTTWFRAFCVSAVLCALWMLYLWRLRQLASHMQDQLKARLAEREHIARELHDTLLQGVQGMILRFQAATNRIAVSEPARLMMEDALDSADRVMAEGRERVQDLRSHVTKENALPNALNAAGKECAEDYPLVSFRVVVEGTARELRALVRDEFYWIGREALLNAFRHSSAAKIDVELAYKNREFALRLIDDGCGIAPEILTLGGRPGHWGLAGMHERAKKIGAHMTIASHSGIGTHIELIIPAAIAYRRNLTVSLWRRRWRTASKDTSR
jgi:signal transduction histidine kinase/ligand-binding sensor domain-containing protein